jgi:hypothetical protein
MDAEKLRDKCHSFHNMGAVRLHNGSPTYNANFEPFSKKTTTTTLDDIFYKTTSGYKKDQNKKYLKTLFPYIAMRNIIVDLEGNIVFCLQYNNIPGSRYTNIVTVNKEFFEKYETEINNRFSNRVYEIYEGKDIFDKFYTKYQFNNLSEIVDFKNHLINHMITVLQHTNIANYASISNA